MRSRPSSTASVNDEGGEQIEDKGGQIVHPSDAPPSAPLPNAQPHDKGISPVANETGASRREVRDAVKIETQVTPEAKEAARDAGLIDNNSAMLEVASVATHEQPAKVREIATKKPRVRLSNRAKKALQEHRDGVDAALDDLVAFLIESFDREDLREVSGYFDRVACSLDAAPRKAAYVFRQVATPLCEAAKTQNPPEEAAA
jgi:hypothetical protein